MTEDAPKARDRTPIWQEWSKSARSAQVEYGRWIINTLWLMHSGSIAGLLYKWNAVGIPPKPWSIGLFVFGIILAFGAAAAAWFNFSIAALFYDRNLTAGEPWIEPDKSGLAKWLLRTMFLAIACIALSIVCLIVGAVLVMLLQ